MAKDTFWFPHDFEPTSDPKIQALLAEYGGIGYGIYWRLVEMIHSDNSHKIPLKQYIFIAIAKQMSANTKQNKCKIQQIEITPDCVKCLIEDCILIFELFFSDGNFFWSDRANRNLEKRAEISKTRSEIGKKGAIAKQEQAIAKQNEAKDRRGEENTLESSNTLHNQVKNNSEIFEKKINENHGDEFISTNPTQAESYFVKRNRELREIKAKRLAGIAHEVVEQDGNIPNG